MKEPQDSVNKASDPHEPLNLEKEENVNELIEAFENNESQKDNFNSDSNSNSNVNYNDTNMSMFCSSMDVSNITEKTIEEIRLDIRENELDKETYLENLFKETKEKLISPMEPIKKFNWDEITQIIEGAYNDYTSEMQSIILKFEKVDVKRSIWQEAAHKIDGETSNKKMNRVQTWVEKSENYLDFLQNEIFSGVEVMKETIQRLKLEHRQKTNQ